MPVQIKGSARLVVEKLKAIPESMDCAIAIGLARGLLNAVTVSGLNYLSGPRPEKLDVRTGRLRGGLASEVQISKARIIGRFGDNVKYAAFHEFGFHGIVNVAAHTRILSTFNHGGQKVDLRRKWIDNKGKLIGNRDTHAQALARRDGAAFVFSQNVRAHSRKMDYNGRPFLRPALENSMDVIRQEIAKELHAL